MSARETHENSRVSSAFANLPRETSVVLRFVGYNSFFLTCSKQKEKLRFLSSSRILTFLICFFFFLIPCVGAWRYTRFTSIFLHILPVGFMTSVPGSDRLPFKICQDTVNECLFPTIKVHTRKCYIYNCFRGRLKKPLRAKQKEQHEVKLRLARLQEMGGCKEGVNNKQNSKHGRAQCLFCVNKCVI